MLEKDPSETHPLFSIIPMGIHGDITAQNIEIYQYWLDQMLSKILYILSKSPTGFRVFDFVVW